MSAHVSVCVWAPGMLPGLGNKTSILRAGRRLIIIDMKHTIHAIASFCLNLLPNYQPSGVHHASRTYVQQQGCATVEGASPSECLTCALPGGMSWTQLCLQMFEQAA